jgi:VWFA-related protein
MHSRYLGLFSLVMVSCCVLPFHAQTGAPVAKEPVPVFKANAQAVVVDVVVTKGSDEPVLGLHKQDFEVSEDGKPVAIDYFEEHTTKALPPGALPPLPKMPPNVYTNVPPAPESDSVNVLLLDSLNTEKQDQSYVHLQILNFLKKMQPGTRCAIFTLGSKLRFVQGFTTDSSELIAALNDKKNGVSPEKDWSSHSRSDEQDDKGIIATMVGMSNGHMTGGIQAIHASMGDFADFQYGVRASMTLEALQYLARYLGGVPGRKNLIWFASSFPVTVFPSTAQRETMDNLRIYANEVKQTADLLTVSKVAAYPIGAQGMMNDHWFEGDSAGNGRASGGGGTLREIAEEAGKRSDTIYAMEQLATDTGGKAYYNTNDLNAAVTHAINDGSHYYTLIYTPTNKKMDGQYRRIEIKTTQGKYKLAYRRGYNAENLLAQEPKPEVDPLHPLLNHGLPSATQILYGVRVAPLSPQPEPNAPRAGRNSALASPVTRYSVDFMIRWTDVVLMDAPHDRHTGKLQVDLVAYNRDGMTVNWEGAAMLMNPKPEVYTAIQKSGIPAHLEIDLPNTDLFLETGIYDWNSGKAGTLEIPIHPVAPTPAAAQQPTPR